MVQHCVFARVAINRASYLLFSAMCLAAILITLFGVKALHAHNAAEFLRSLRVNNTCALLMVALYFWFIAAYTGMIALPVRIAVTAAMVVLAALNLTRPYTLQYDAFTGVAPVHLPWGETIMRGVGRNGPYAYVAMGTILAIFVYTLGTLTALYRKTRRRATLWILIATILFTLSAVEGVLARLSVIHTFPLGPFGFLTMIAVMGATLSVDVQQHLRASERNFRAILRNASDGIHVLDADGNVLEASNTFCEMLGYTRDQVLGMNAAQWDDQFTATAFSEVLARQLAKPARAQYEAAHRRGDGSLLDVEITQFPLELEGRPVMFNASRDITERKASHSRIQRLAFFDQLTDLPNRRMLDEKLGQILAHSARTGRHGALLLVDLDNFKTINDSVGHLSGDQVLTQIAERLSTVIRKEDTVARLGGDEFIVLLSDLEERESHALVMAKAVGDKVLRALSQPYLIGDREFRSSCSVGVTLFAGEQLSPEELIKQADIAMYQAKNAGRNTLRFFDPEMQHSINTRATLQNDLHKAIEARQLVLHYQLQIDAHGRPFGAEALIRWMHPDRGLVPPAQFIPLAEETGLIVPIGRWALETACAQLMKWRKDPQTRGLSLALNVSSRQLRNPDFADSVHSVMRGYEIAPGRLKLELTESSLLHNIEETIAAMKRLKDLGVTFSLDDFGTGYSSLQYLKRLPLDELKIDKSFVMDIAAEGSDNAIVKTIIAIARALNIRVIAEGVETQTQREVLLRAGCTHFQGFLFARPVPADELGLLLAAPRAAPAGTAEAAPCPIA